MSAPVELPPPQDLGEAGIAPPPPLPSPPLPTAPPPALPQRGRRVVGYVLGAAALVVLVAALTFAALTGRAALREHRTAERWQSRSQQQDEVIDALRAQQSAAAARAAELTVERDRLLAELEAQLADATALRAELAATTAALAEAEDRIAELAGAEAMARDLAALRG